MAATKHVLDLQRLDGIIAPIVSAHGAEIVELEWKNEPGGWVLRVAIEREGSAEQKRSTEDAAVSLEVCSNISRELSPALDVVDLFPARYNLEVSSPGVERPLRRLEDFARFVGKKAKVKLGRAIDGVSAFTGTIESTDAATIVLAADPPKVSATKLKADPSLGEPKRFSFPVSDLAHANLVFEFGPQAPAKSGKQPK